MLCFLRKYNHFKVKTATMCFFLTLLHLISSLRRRGADFTTAAECTVSFLNSKSVPSPGLIVLHDFHLPSSFIPSPA